MINHRSELNWYCKEPILHLREKSDSSHQWEMGIRRLHFNCEVLFINGLINFALPLTRNPTRQSGQTDCFLL